MSKMTVIYADSEEKYVKNVVLYGHTDNYLYTNDAYAEADRIDMDTLQNLCLKGVIVLYEGAYYVPVSFKNNTTNVSVTIATNVAASASSSVTLYSKEYLAD